jgi:hypothetical protein
VRANDEHIGATEVNPVTFRFEGNLVLAKSHIIRSRVILGELKHRMQFNDIWQDMITRQLPDGTVIKASSIKGNNGSHDIDTIIISSPKDDPIKKEMLTIYGYIILHVSSLYVVLPNGKQAGQSAIDTPTQEESRVEYNGNQAFDYVGYPDFGGVKRIPLHARDEDPSQFASNEFEELWFHDATATSVAVTSTPPEGTTWEEIYSTWQPRKSPRITSSGPDYFEGWAGNTNLGTIVRRIDGDGLWIPTSPYQWTADGLILLDEEVPSYPVEFGANGHSVLIMMPSNDFSVKFSPIGVDKDSSYWGFTNSFEEFEFDADVVNYPEAWIPDTTGTEETNIWYPWLPNPAWPPENPGSLDYPVVTVHKWDVTLTETANLAPGAYTGVKIPITVPFGPHRIMTRGNEFDYQVKIYTSQGVITRTVKQDNIDDKLSLTIVVGQEGRLSDLIY